MDATESRLVERFQDEEINSDELFEELENELDDDVLVSYREQRLQQLSREINSIKTSQRLGLEEVNDEASIINIMSQNTRGNAVIMFYRENFKTCLEMQEVLESVAGRHFAGVRYYKIDVLSCPFLVTKLKIKVLPCVLLYASGVERTRLIGFERLGDFKDKSQVTQNLETIMYQCGIVNRTVTSFKRVQKKLVGDDDDELDI